LNRSSRKQKGHFLNKVKLRKEQTIDIFSKRVVTFQSARFKAVKKNGRIKKPLNRTEAEDNGWFRHLTLIEQPIHSDKHLFRGEPDYDRKSIKHTSLRESLQQQNSKSIKHVAFCRSLLCNLGSDEKMG
jgi:hypothetical protein